MTKRFRHDDLRRSAEQSDEVEEHGSSLDDRQEKVFGPSQRDIDRSWDGYETGDGRRDYSGIAWKTAIVVVSLIILASMSLGVLSPLFGGSRNSQPVEPERTVARVLRVIDGRTLVVSTGGGEQTVRLIGVEAPAFGDVFFELSREVSKSWIADQDVLLEADQRDGDDQGRLLRYLYYDGVMINAALIRNGLGLSETEHPNIRYDDFLVEMERQARESAIGIWDPAYSDLGNSADSTEFEVLNRSGDRTGTPEGTTSS